MDECRAMHGVLLQQGDKVHCHDIRGIAEGFVRDFTKASIIIQITYPHKWRRIIRKGLAKTQIIKV